MLHGAGMRARQLARCRISGATAVTHGFFENMGSGITNLMHGTSLLRRLSAVLLAAGFLVAPVFATANAEAKQIVGWIEKVRIYPGDLLIQAKLDTGAKTSSLNCDCMNFFERNGVEWVRFSLTNDDGAMVSLEREIYRNSRVKRHFGENQERPVVKLGLCLGNVYQEVEVNLVDRSGLNYQMLIGRTALQGHFAIDPAATYTTKPRCQGVPAGE